MASLRAVFAIIGVLAVIAVAAAFLVIWTGAYDVAADSGEGVVDRIAEFTRENSVAARDSAVTPPPLGNPTMIPDGAAEYAHLCTGCHLAPGMASNAMRRGMTPEPPVLAKRRHPVAREDYWIIKHGIKMTAMPAWGLSYRDRTLWSIVAFLQQLPGMSPARYHALVAQGRDYDHSAALAPDPAPGSHPM